MAHFAKIVNGKVVNVVVAEKDYFNNFTDTTPGEWIQTSYNTHGGVHSDGGTPLRGNYAGVGFTYDSTNDVFYEPKPFPSWTLNESTWLWECPVAYPDSGNHDWNEEDQSWDAVE